MDIDNFDDGVVDWECEWIRSISFWIRPSIPKMIDDYVEDLTLEFRLG